MAEAGVAGAEVIDGHLNTSCSQSREDGFGCTGVCHQDVLGQIQLEGLGREPDICESRKESGEEVLVQELLRGDVHRHGDACQTILNPTARFPACFSKYPFANRYNE